MRARFRSDLNFSVEVINGKPCMVALSESDPMASAPDELAVISAIAAENRRRFYEGQPND